MPDNIQHKLFNLELDPPAATWDSISKRLDQEFDPNELKLAAKLYDYETTPPTIVWQNIETQLGTKQQARIISFNWKRLGAAAAVIGAITIITIYIFNWPAKQVSISAKKEPSQQNRPDLTAKKNDTPLNNLPILSILIPKPNKKTSEKRYTRNERLRVSPALPTKSEQNSRLADQELTIPYVSASRIPPINAAAPVSVRAPLIRDASGKVILDRDLVRSANENYIIVTGPNGEQTKISDKFFSALSYLNPPMEDGNYFDFNTWLRAFWQKRFQDWRNKMQQSSFVPSGSNFLDIFELNELIKENQ